MKYCKMLSDLWSLWCPNNWCHSNENCRMVRAGWGGLGQLGVAGPKVPMVSNSSRGFYIPIIRIPIKGGRFPIPNIGSGRP